MATANRSKKILEKARKLASKTKKKKSEKPSSKKVTTHPEGQNAPQSKKYTQESDKTLSAKATGWRWTKEGAKKAGKDVNSKPSQSDIEKYRNETFIVKGRVNKSGPKGVGDGSFRYLYVERRADKADLKRTQKLAKGGYMAKGSMMAMGGITKGEFDYNDIQKGDLVNFGSYGNYYVADTDYDASGGNKYFWVVKEEENRKKSSASGKTMLKSSAKYIVEEFAKGGTLHSDEVSDFKSYVKGFYGNKGLYKEYFPPKGASNDEIDHAIEQYVAFAKSKDGSWGGGDSLDREMVRDVMLYNRGNKKDLEYARGVKEVMQFHNKKEYGGILQPMTGGVNADPRFDIYNTAMFVEKGAELAKGGELEFLVDSRHGVYVPQVFVEQYDLKQFGISDVDAAYYKDVFRNPDSDEYFEAWDELMSKAKTKDGETITLADGDLWLVPAGYEYDDFYAKGGKTHEQGYDDREDESLAMRHGKISSKDFVGSHKEREHSRRDDAHFETRG